MRTQMTRTPVRANKVCANDSWIADHDFGCQIGYAGYSDFFYFLAKVALNVWDDEEEIEQKDVFSGSTGPRFGDAIGLRRRQRLRPLYNLLGVNLRSRLVAPLTPLTR